MKTSVIKSLMVGAVTAVLSAGVFTFVSSALNNAQAADCSANAVIKCGVTSVDDMKQKYTAERNSPGAKTMFAHMNITQQVMDNAVIKEGIVTKSGEVKVGDAVLARDAVTMGRQYIEGSQKHVVNGTTFYTRKPSVSFRSNSLTAFVLTNRDGHFIAAVIKDCGNPVTGTPVAQPKPKCDIPGKTHLTKDDPNCKPDAPKCDVPGKTHLPKDDPNCKPDAPKCDIPGKTDLPKDDPACKPEAPKCDVPGKTHLPKDDPACKPDAPKCDVPGKTNLPKDDPNCKDVPVSIQACDTKSNSIVTITKDLIVDNDRYTDDLTKCAPKCTVPGKETLPKDDPACKPDEKTVSVCDTTTKQIVTVTQAKATDKKYSTNQSDCEEKCTIKGKETLPADSEKCEEDATPVVAELPKTGAGDIVMGSIGLGALAAASYYYYLSRRSF